MTIGELSLSDLTAGALADAVRARRLDPATVTRYFLERIDVLDARVGAFEAVRHERALAEAEALAARDDLDRLPLAGVPVAIKDNTDVAGEPSRWGSPLISAAPRPTDDEVVRRLREAGAVVLGKTRVPELSAWGTADGPLGICRNPWDLSLTAGGSSGGSAAAVAAGMAPLALGSDGLGSIRIPAAACGVVGVKPGPDVVPAGIGASSWLGMAEHGPLATTVEDAALMLAVLAERPDFAAVAPPERRLRVAVSTRAQLAGTRVDREFASAAEAVGQALARAGHDVVPAHPPYTLGVALDVVSYWCAAVAEEAEAVDTRRFDRRTRQLAAAGRFLRRIGRARPEARERWRTRLAPFFQAFDLLLTPTLARPPIAAAGWDERSALANVYADANYAPFPAAWNFAGYPAATIPAGLHSSGVPLSVQLVAAPGDEPLLLSVARFIEETHPWPRHAPLASSDAAAVTIPAGR